MRTSPASSAPKRPRPFLLWLRTKLIGMGILAPPGSDGSELTDEELQIRKRFFFENRRRPRGGPV